MVAVAFGKLYPSPPHTPLPPPHLPLSISRFLVPYTYLAYPELARPQRMRRSNIAERGVARRGLGLYKGGTLGVGGCQSCISACVFDAEKKLVKKN